MDSFWVEISAKHADICWLVKVFSMLVEIVLTKLRRSNKEFSRKCCLLFQVILALKNGF